MITSKTRSLTSQIKAAEQHVLNRFDKINFRSKVLVNSLYQQIKAPSTLWIAGGGGFMLGELTKRQPVKVDGTKNRLKGEISPLKVALNLVTSIQSLYTALPMFFVIKSFLESTSTDPISTKQPIQHSESISNLQENS